MGPPECWSGCRCEGSFPHAMGACEEGYPLYPDGGESFVGRFAPQKLRGATAAAEDCQKDNSLSRGETPAPVARDQPACVSSSPWFSSSLSSPSMEIRRERKK